MHTFKIVYVYIFEFKKIYKVVLGLNKVMLLKEKGVSDTQTLNIKSFYFHVFARYM